MLFVRVTSEKFKNRNDATQGTKDTYIQPL